MSPRKAGLLKRSGWVVLGLAGAVLATGGLGCVAFAPPPLEKVFAGRVPPEEVRFPLSGGRELSGAETGDLAGPLVLFVHGSPGAWRDFAQVLAHEPLGARARLLAVDRLGWGVDASRGLEVSLAAHARALAEVLRARAEHLPAVVVGHSLGAPVAARLALDFPELVRALVLVSGAVDPELEETTWYQALGRTWLVRWLLPDLLARADDEIRPLRGELELLAPRWAELTTPVYVLHGEDDALVPVANADFVARVVIRAPLAIERLPDQGHLIPWEQPAFLAELCLRVLSETADALPSVDFRAY